MWRSTKEVGVQVDEVVPGTKYIARVFGYGVEIAYHSVSSYHPVRNFNEYLGIHMIIKHQLHFRTEWMVGALRAHGFVPSRGFPQACTRTTLSWLFGHRFGPVQASPTMMYVTVSPSPASREASRDLWHSIGPLAMGVFKLQTSPWTHPLCPQI